MTLTVLGLKTAMQMYSQFIFIFRGSYSVMSSMQTLPALLKEAQEAFISNKLLHQQKSDTIKRLDNFFPKKKKKRKEDIYACGKYLFSHSDLCLQFALLLSLGILPLRLMNHTQTHKHSCGNQVPLAGKKM